MVSLLCDTHVMPHVPSMYHPCDIHVPSMTSIIFLFISRYLIDENTDPDGQFAIGETSGRVTVAKSLDRETVEVHQLTLLAVDKGRSGDKPNLT